MQTLAGFMVGVVIAYLTWLVMSAADRQASNYYRECYTDLLVRYNEKLKMLSEQGGEEKNCTKCREGIEWN